MDSHQFPSPTRRDLVVAALLASVLLVGAAGVYYHDAGELDAELTVTSISDPSGIGRGTTISLRLANHEGRSIQPAFNVIHSTHQTRFYYRVLDGPAELAPGDAGSYTIEAPTASAAPPPGATVLVTANDAGTQQRVRSRPTKFTEARRLAVTNPAFEYWSYGSNEPVRHPVGWDRTTSDHGAERPSMDGAGRGGATLRVENISGRSGPWAMAGLHQSVRLPRTVTTSVTPHVDPPRGRGHPPAAIGLEVADDDRRLWIVFANVSDRSLVTRTSGELTYAIVTVPARSGERTIASVDLRRVYRRMGWSTEGRSVELLVFVAAYPDVHRSPVSATFHRVNATA